MIKTLLLKYWDNLISILHHKSAFPTAFMVCATFWVCVFTVDLPSKNKTTFENWLDGRYENWRLHSDTGKTFIAKDAKDELWKECEALKRLLKEGRQARWQLMAIKMDPQKKAIEMEIAKADLEDTVKKLEVAELALAGALHTYNQLVASR